MKRAAIELACLPDERLFVEVSDGISLIVQNIVELVEAAEILRRQGQYRVANAIYAAAEEEAGKVLVLIDLIRCPIASEWKDAKNRIARRCYDHVAKRIYAKMCWAIGIQSFEELQQHVEMESWEYHLDGPNDVDWIFSNAIKSEREGSLYVDYVQDITEEPSKFLWRQPPDPLWKSSWHRVPDAVDLVQALVKVGAVSPDGLAVIADVWRKFEPNVKTNRAEVSNIIEDTLEKLAKLGGGIKYREASNFIVRHWPFPMWSLQYMGYNDKPQNMPSPGKLRQMREHRVKLIEAIEEKRDPPPAISRLKVEKLSDAYWTWRREVDAQDGNRDEERGMRVRSAADLVKDFELPSYKRLVRMFQDLTEDERMALLALGWYGWQGGGDWSAIYKRAINEISTLDDGYQIGYGWYWLAGLERWEEQPQPFMAGQRRPR